MDFARDFRIQKLNEHRTAPVSLGYQLIHSVSMSGIRNNENVKH